jgi:hypothetical protein
VAVLASVALVYVDDGMQVAVTAAGSAVVETDHVVLTLKKISFVLLKNGNCHTNMSSRGSRRVTVVFIGFVAIITTAACVIAIHIHFLRWPDRRMSRAVHVHHSHSHSHTHP